MTRGMPQKPVTDWSGQEVTVPLAMPAAQEVVIVIFLGIVVLMGIAIFAVLRRGGRQ